MLYVYFDARNFLKFKACDALYKVHAISKCIKRNGNGLHNDYFLLLMVIVMVSFDSMGNGN